MVFRGYFLYLILLIALPHFNLAKLYYYTLPSVDHDLPTLEPYDDDDGD